MSLPQGQQYFILNFTLLRKIVALGENHVVLINCLYNVSDATTKIIPTTCKILGSTRFHVSPATLLIVLKSHQHLPSTL